MFVYKIDNINLDVRYTIEKTDIIYSDIEYIFNNINFSKISRYYAGYNSIAYNIEIDEKLRNIHTNIINKRN